MSQFQFAVFSDRIASLVRRRSIGASETLFAKGTPVETIFRVQQGGVRLVTYPSDGKQLVLYRATTGEVFGEEHLTQAEYGYTAIAVVDSVIEYVDRDELLDEIDCNRDALLGYLACLGGRYHQVRANFERLAIPAATDRVFSLLHSLADPQDKTVRCRYPMKELSDDLDLSPESMYRALGRLERDGRIQRTNGSIRVCHAA